VQFLANYYSGFSVLVIFLILLPFAFQAYPKLAVGVFLFTFGLWLITIVPTFLNLGYRTMLDRQFLEMMLYIPFSVMSGTGFAGFIKKLPTTGVSRQFLSIVMSGCVLSGFLNINSIYPDQCCDYFKESDQVAFEWLRERTSEHALVLISTYDNDGQMVGTDAGIWLFPLIGQHVNKQPFNTNWNSLPEIEQICSSGAKEIYIYVGGRAYSFDNAQLARGNWTKLVF